MKPLRAGTASGLSRLPVTCATQLKQGDMSLWHLGSEHLAHQLAMAGTPKGSAPKPRVAVLGYPGDQAAQLTNPDGVASRSSGLT
jgi:hypothetical protein